MELVEVGEMEVVRRNVNVMKIRFWFSKLGYWAVSLFRLWVDSPPRIQEREVLHK